MVALCFRDLDMRKENDGIAIMICFWWGMRLLMRDGGIATQYYQHLFCKSTNIIILACYCFKLHDASYSELNETSDMTMFP